MNILESIKAANRPGPPEDSIRLRVIATASVLVGVAACSAQSEVARPNALIASALIVAGMTFSYMTRTNPPGYIKLLAAAGAVSLLAWFVNSLSGGQITDITTVEDPLSVLFVGIQVVHSFHVPARRDLVFTIAGGAGLMALAGAQSIDLSFAYYAIPWLLFTLLSLVEMWRSASRGGVVSTRGLALSVTGVGAATLVVFLLLPAPTVAVKIGFISRPGNGGPISSPGALAGDSGTPSQLSKPGTPAGRTRIGGYLGFASHLDTALRGNLGKTLVMRVRAQRPSYWIGETYDRWDGQNWISTFAPKASLRGGSPFYIPQLDDTVALGPQDLQTFYIQGSSPNLVFHADAARQVWFPTPSLLYALDGTIVSPLALGKGAVYTVESDINTPTPGQLRSVGAFTTAQAGPSNYTQLPHAYPRVAALARSVTAGASTTYDKVQALIAWIGSHTRYSTDIPAIPPGTDTVDQFLFGSRVGFCEQISTSLAVMLRSLGILAREAVGYVPGGYNPITDLYDVRAEDAHAWVQVFFPGYGWQSFDPTAAVPLANPSPGGTALKDVGHALSHVPIVPTLSGTAGLGLTFGIRRWRRTVPTTWDGLILREMDRFGRRRSRPRAESETLLEFATALDKLPDARSNEISTGVGWYEIADRVTAAAYGHVEPSEFTRQELLADARSLRAAGAKNRSPRFRLPVGSR